MTKRDYTYFTHAKHIAELSDFPRVHIGCIATINSKIISTGFNTTKSHPLQAHYNQYRDFYDGCNINHKLHAEIACLIPLWNCDINWNKVHLYIYRIRKDIEHGLAPPCPSCMAAIRDLGIKNIYYTTNDGFAHETIK